MAEASPHARCLACAFPFWEQLTPEEQERLCRFTRPVHYAKGARVHSPLESCVGILLLRSGQLRSYLLSEDGRDVTLYRLFGGEVCILSASCVMDAVNIDLYIDAEEDTEALCISAGIFRQLMQEDVYKRQPLIWGGKWHGQYARPEQPFILELGCGKGGFISQLACAHPENNYLGIDITDKVLILAKRKIEAAYQAAGRPIDNVKIMSTDIERIKGVITPEDEVSRIYINFCNPWSKNDSSHKHRLTYPRQLIAYREFLKDGGEIYFKTDDDDLFRDSVEYFPASGYDIEWITYDLHENEPEWNIRTEHEGMFTEMGIKIKALIARKKPGADSVTWVDPKVLKRMAREAAAAEAATQEGEGNV